MIHDNNPRLLLGNVSTNKSSPTEAARRQPGQFKSSFTITEYSTSVASFMIKQYDMHFVPLLERLQVDSVILDHNYTRQENFLRLFRAARMRTLSSNSLAGNKLYLNETEYAPLLEFYLQMDIDMFYMRTCSFRDARPRSNTEGLFCSKAPEGQYTMQPCGRCNLCSATITTTATNCPQQGYVQLNAYEKHQFANGYQPILNCPATCSSKNIIYALTCLCGRFDYISEARYQLAVRSEGHRKMVMTLLQKFLIGDRNCRRLSTDEANDSALNNDNMALYQHIRQCSAAIQLFLDSNPNYWRFVPMSIGEAEQEDINHRNFAFNTAIQNQDKNLMKWLDNTPKPAPNFRFSNRQIAKQVEFYKLKLGNNPINDRAYPYNAKIIALLPLNTSDLFRQIVHSLFVTHTEAKLNTLGHIFDSNFNVSVTFGTWCASLVRRPTSSSSQRH